MFWSKKEEKSRLPDLPPLNMPPQRPSMQTNSDEEDYEKHRLPSFPDSPMQRGFSQTIIKDAVNSEELKETASFDDVPTRFKTIEMGEVPSKPIARLSEPPSEQYIPKPAKYETSLKPKNDIYVKIDKFTSAKRSLSAIHEKLSEIDELLRRIREIKLREDQELSGWEKEISSLKSKMQEVTESIFEKTE